MKCFVQSTASSFGCMILLFYLASYSHAQESVQQTTNGDQSPAIVADGDVNITYGVPQKVVDRLLKTLEEKDVAIEERDAKIRELAEKYKEIEERLAKRSAEEPLTAQAKEKLETGDLEGAEKLLQQSLERNLQAFAEKKKSAASDAFELGSIKELQLDYQGAMNYYEQAVQLEPQNSNYLNNFGVILHTLGEHENAIEYFSKALEIDLEVFGDKHPKIAIRYNNLGEAWRQLGDAKKAIEHYNKALEIDLNVFGDKHPNVARDYNNLGMAWSDLRNAKKAVEYITKAIEIFTSVYGSNHPSTKTVQSNLDFVGNSQ